MSTIRAHSRPGSQIDVHAHTLPPSFVHSLEKRAREEPSGVVEEYISAIQSKRDNARTSPTAHYMYGTLDDRLHLLDRADIDVQVLSSGSSLAALPLSEDWSRYVVEAWNDAVREEVQKHGQRFRMFASLPLPFIEASLIEMERVSSWPCVVGYTMTSHVQGRPIADDRWKPVFEVCNDSAAVVFCHPNGFRCGNFEPRYLTVDVGTQFEDTLSVLQLAEGGYLEAFPNIQWLVPHLGGTLPFVIGRVDEHWERDAPLRQTDSKPSDSMDGLLFDTAGHDAFAVEMAVARFGGDRFLFGSDFPMVRPDELPEIHSAVRKAVLRGGSDPEGLGIRSRRVLGMEASR